MCVNTSMFIEYSMCSFEDILIDVVKQQYCFVTFFQLKLLKVYKLNE